MNCWYFCTSLFNFINCWLTWWLQNSCLQNQSRSDNRISMKYGRGFTPMKPVMYIFSLSVQWRVAWFIISLHPILFLSNQRNPSLGLSDIRRNKSFLLFAIPSATGNKNNFQQNCSCIIHLFALLHKKNFINSLLCFAFSSYVNGSTDSISWFYNSLSNRSMRHTGQG